ncbi:CEP131_1 [Blepharisma stoltei]|uniref:5-azacytidine-induced protein 1 n=1 Tax=Blepharisma stoltei TaxID=1481888 RepID=A0AAU9IW61_9CILI|nr:unnamed protein product [Blepharisma stoltei]
MMKRGDTKKNPSQVRTKKQLSHPPKPVPKHPVQVSLSSVICIQRWWRKMSMKLMSQKINRMKNQFKARQESLENDAKEIQGRYHLKSNSCNQSTLNTEDSRSGFIYNDSSMNYYKKNFLPPKTPPAKHEESSILRPNSVFSNSICDSSDRMTPDVRSQTSEKASNLMNFLNESENVFKHQKSETSSNIESITYKLELEDAAKTISSLKEIIFKQKQKIIEKDQEKIEEIERALENQKKEFEEVIEKNVKFIEQLLAEKEIRLKQLNELNVKIKEMEGQNYIAMQEMREKFQKEMKKGKDAVITTEKIKRDSWMKEKAKEIKEQTAKGLEPEISRLINEHKRVIEKLKEEHQLEMRQYKHEIEQNYEKRLLSVREEQKSKLDDVLEREREHYKSRINEMHIKQEEEFQKMRKNWSEDVATEHKRNLELRAHDETIHQEKLKKIEEENQQKLRDQEKKFQEDLEELERKHENKIKKLKFDYEEEKREFMDLHQNRMNKDLDTQKNDLKNELIRQRDRELKEIVEKLGEEQVAYKKRIDKESESKIRTMREKFESEFNQYQELVNNLKSKIDESSQAKRNLDENFDLLNRKIQDQELMILKQKGQKKQLKEHIENLEARIQKFKAGESEYAEEVRIQERRQQKKLQEELEYAKMEINRLKAVHEEKIEEMTQREAEELEEIEQRVKQTISRKDEKIRELQEDLKFMQIKAQKLEELLEKQRRDLSIM